MMPHPQAERHKKSKKIIDNLAFIIPLLRVYPELKILRDPCLD
jgi:hypothetical protein